MTGATNPRLEAAIREADDPHEAATVYVDWLQSQGDPRGWLNDVTPELLERHATQLFGAAASLLPMLELDWQGGVLMGLSTTRTSNGPESASRALDLLFELLELPICACLRSLRLRGFISLEIEDVETRLELVDPLVRAGIRALCVDTPLSVNFARCELLPRLEVLELTGSLRRPLHCERLRELSIEVDGDSTAALSGSTLPQLRELTLRVEEREWGALAALLSCPTLQPIRSLALGDVFWGDRHGAEIIEALVEIPLVTRLDRRGGA
jgi:hypothetical protein